jgi:hypothetical protein
MSSNPSVITPAAAPFVPTTTPNIERANRLISLRAHPGFLDILRITQEQVQEAVDACSNYPGWDTQQILVLQVRQKCATEFHQMLLARVNDAIQMGIDESRANVASLPEKSVAEAVDQGDYVRQKALEKFDEFDSRPAGSF